MGFVVVRGTQEKVRVGKIVAAGQNYADHTKEMGSSPVKDPILFLKPSTAIIHEGEPIVFPRRGELLHHEVELGVVIGKEKRGPDDAFSDAFNFINENWSVGLTLSFPISNILTRAGYISAKLELEQSLLQLQDLEKQVVLEVRDAVRDIESLAKRYEALQAARRHAEMTLEAEEKKMSVGLSTNYFVLQFQEQLADITSQEIRALIDYNLALARFEKVAALVQTGGHGVEHLVGIAARIQAGLNKLCDIVCIAITDGFCN